MSEAMPVVVCRAIWRDEKCEIGRVDRADMVFCDMIISLRTIKIPMTGTIGRPLSMSPLKIK